MADALLSPAVGGSFWAATAGALAWCSGKVKADLDDRRVPLMGVLGAFIFAVQMINFTIPGTGSSGHLGGGLLLAILLGPSAALLTIASVLLVQALFFADGGLLALGCNIFNLGFLPCFLAYPLIYRRIVGPAPSLRRIAAGSTAAAVFALQAGALGVVAETVLSGRSELPFGPFALLMLSIHLVIGLVEGVVTAGILGFLWKTRPEIVAPAAGSRAGRTAMAAGPGGTGRGDRLYRGRPVLVRLQSAGRPGVEPAAPDRQRRAGGGFRERTGSGSATAAGEDRFSTRLPFPSEDGGRRRRRRAD